MPYNQYLLTLLINGEFWMSPPDKLNDPYEGDFRIKGIQNYHNTGFIEKLLKFKRKNFLDDFSYEKDLNLAIENQEVFANMLYEYINQLIRQEFGITCFSRNPRNMKMWSHYADSHKGVCLVFDEKQLENSILRRRSEVYFKEVIYNKSLISLDIIDHDSDENGEEYIGIPRIPAFLYNKLTAWKEEKEVRFVLEKDFNIFPDRRLKFDKSSLKGVIFGSRVQPNDALTIINLINSLEEYGKVNFYTARKDIEKPKILIDKLKLKEYNA
jgi:hypothetical protein